MIVPGVATAGYQRLSGTRRMGMREIDVPQIENRDEVWFVRLALGKEWFVLAPIIVLG